MSKKRDKKPINVKIGDRVLECQLKGHKSDEFMASLCGLEYPSSYKRCLNGITGFDVSKFAAMHNDLGWDLNYIIAGDNKKNISKKGTIDYTFEGIKHFFLEATPDVQEEIRAIVLEQYLSELPKKRK